MTGAGFHSIVCHGTVRLPCEQSACLMQEDRQRCDALLFYHEHGADGGSGDLGVKQPLPPPLAALHDAIIADAAVLRMKIDDLRDLVEVSVLLTSSKKLSARP